MPLFCALYCVCASSYVCRAGSSCYGTIAQYYCNFYAQPRIIRTFLDYFSTHASLRAI
ncbi:hypothetical protein HMPREF3214_00312 [Alloscardovia omnicolens]|nr:hypothetical protein HMPREF3214_00312 [Alloscardovia omnicolens]